MSINPDSLGAADASAKADSQDLIATPGSIEKRFCPRCGAAWQTDWSDCPCAERLLAAQAAQPSGSGTKDLRSAILLYFFVLVIGIAGAVCGYLIGGKTSGSEAMPILASDVATSLLVVIWCAMRWRLIRPALIRIPSAKWFAIAVVMALGTFLIAHFCVLGMETLFGAPSDHLIAELKDSRLGWPMIVLLICVQPAIIEELAFRGVIYGGMVPVLGARETVLVSSLMFMIIHLSVPSFPHLLIIGLAIAFLRWRTGSLYPGMALHFCHNFLATLVESPYSG